MGRAGVITWERREERENQEATTDRVAFAWTGTLNKMYLVEVLFL